MKGTIEDLLRLGEIHRSMAEVSLKSLDANTNPNLVPVIRERAALSTSLATMYYTAALAFMQVKS